MGDLPEYRCFFVPVGSMMEPELHQPIHTCKKGGFQEIKDRRFNNLQISGPRFIRVASGQEQEKEASGGLRGIDKGLSTHPCSRSVPRLICTDGSQRIQRTPNTVRRDRSAGLGVLRPPGRGYRRAREGLPRKASPAGALE